MGVGEGEGKRSGAKWGGERARQINSRSPSSFVRPSVPRGGVRSQRIGLAGSREQLDGGRRWRRRLAHAL